MISHKRAVCHAVLFAVAGFFAASSPASAQTFNSYRCVDGTRFIVGFYPHDSRAYLQLDGRAVTLRKRLALSGTRYSGSDRMRGDIRKGRNFLVPTLLIY
jgi:membrane-bound inhibitor of C-type lysozyme